MFTSILFGKLYENIPKFSNFPLTSLSGYLMEADLCPGSSFLLQFTQAYASVKISVYSLYFTTNISSFIFMLELLFLKVKHKDGKLSLLLFHKLKKKISSAWKALGSYTWASHSFLTSTYILLSKIDLLFFIWKDIFPSPSLSIS